MNIYISKSNQADPEVLLWTRKQIKKEGNTVIEFTGGPYNPGLIKTADKIYAILHPQQMKGTAENPFFLTGRGVGHEIKDNKLPAYVIETANETEFVALKVKSVELNNDQDWKKEYYKINVHSAIEEIGEEEELL